MSEIYVFPSSDDRIRTNLRKMVEQYPVDLAPDEQERIVSKVWKEISFLCEPFKQPVTLSGGYSAEQIQEIKLALESVRRSCWRNYAHLVLECIKDKINLARMGQEG